MPDRVTAEVFLHKLEHAPQWMLLRNPDTKSLELHVLRRRNNKPITQTYIEPDPVEMEEGEYASFCKSVYEMATSPELVERRVW
jgi:hypothetical protein